MPPGGLPCRLCAECHLVRPIQASRCSACTRYSLHIPSFFNTLLVVSLPPSLLKDVLRIKTPRSSYSQPITILAAPGDQHAHQERTMTAQASYRFSPLHARSMITGSVLLITLSNSLPSRAKSRACVVAMLTLDNCGRRALILP